MVDLILQTERKENEVVTSAPTICQILWWELYIFFLNVLFTGFPGHSVGQESAAMQEMQETQVRSLGWWDTLEEGMETHSSILAWRLPWTKEWQATIRVVTKSQTWLKWLSTHACPLHFIPMKHSELCLTDEKKWQDKIQNNSTSSLNKITKSQWYMTSKYFREIMSSN